MTSKKSTKQLAWELGLLRKRAASVSMQDRNKKRKPDAQFFSHLIVMDYESTCWENEKSIPQEIIEFPAVLINCQSGEIEDEFHYYVQPSENIRLSRFCHQLTGITQDQVDDGIPIAVCLRKFLIWLRRLQRDKGIVCADDKNMASIMKGQTQPSAKVAAFVTWSDWDLGVCLFYETKRKQIMKPSVLDRWIDLRATYRKFYSRRPDGLNGALQDLGITFDGRQHSGLDDAKNTAKLAYRMICDGCVLNITKTLRTGHFPPPTSTSSSSTSLGPVHSTVGSDKNRTNSEKTSCERGSSKVHSSTSSPVNSKNLKLSERNTNVPSHSRTSRNCHVPEKPKDKSPASVESIAAKNKTGYANSCVDTPVSHYKQSSKRSITPCKMSNKSRVSSDLSPPCHQNELSAISTSTCTNNTSVPSRRSIRSNNAALLNPKSTPLALKLQFKTPSPVESRTLVRITPPLCSCGRRSKRRYVQNPGPNVGRWFFSCPMKNSPSNEKCNGCTFFKWETPPTGSKMPRL